MKFVNFIIVGALGLVLVSANPTNCLGQGNGHGKGHDKHGDDDEQSEHYYKHHEGEARDWYYENERHFRPVSPKKINCRQAWKSNS